MPSLRITLLKTFDVDKNNPKRQATVHLNLQVVVVKVVIISLTGRLKYHKRYALIKSRKSK